MNLMSFSAENDILGTFLGGEDFTTLAYDFWLETTKGGQVCTL